MGQALKEFPTITRAGRTATHPYAEWFVLASKGEGYQINQGEDFPETTQVKTMRHNVYKFAKNSGLSKEDYTTRTVSDEDGEEVGLAIKVTRLPAELEPPKSNKK